MMSGTVQRPQGPRRPLSILLTLLAVGSVGAISPGAAAERVNGSAEAGSGAPTTAAKSSRQQDLARHLKLKGAVVYGAWWCPHCTHQKELFGPEAIELLPYVECDKDDAGRQRCEKAQVNVYPTWDLNGERRVGVLSLEELELWSGYSSR